jgi:osmotically-inducible protein OsmY
MNVNKNPLLMIIVCLVLACGVLGGQNSDQAGARKSKAANPAADCSNVGDSTITTNVKKKLSEAPSLKDATINVATTGGVVTLTGKVKTSNLKGVATRMAKSVDCVKKVDNQLAFDTNSRTGKKSGK